MTLSWKIDRLDNLCAWNDSKSQNESSDLELHYYTDNSDQQGTAALGLFYLNNYMN